MKKLFRLAVVIVVVVVFVFSSNEYVVKARKYVAREGKALFDKGTTELKTSENETVAKIGETIQ